MAKKDRAAGQPNPAIRLSNLRPRLSRLFTEQSDPATFAAELSRLTDGLKPASFLPILVSSVAAQAVEHDQLGDTVGAWLAEHGLLGPLRDLEARQTFDGASREVARSWLEAGGIELASEPEVAIVDLLLDAYEVMDESQGSVTLFWHEDRRRRKVATVSFLLDFEPPWEGALKDLSYRTFSDLTQSREKFLAIWRAGGNEPRRIAIADAAEYIWAALGQSQTQGIRLPADFIAVMDKLAPFLLALPSGKAPALSSAELEALATNGRSPEAIRRDEQLLGYQKRMPDGRIMRIVRPPDDAW